jgi:hypothetical protein
MAQYRFLVDCFIGSYILAGTTLSTQDVGGSLPSNFVPPAAVDPLDTAAVNAFYAAGVQFTPLVRQQWSDVQVAPPITYWKPIPGGPFWQLTGLGAGKPPIAI